MEMGLLYTFRCNARCRHCGFSCGPERREKMEVGEAMGYLRQAADMKEIKRVTFTGGEPLLFYDEICRLVAFSTKLGLTTRLVTNGFWATSEKIAREKLKRLVDAGLTSINFSADQFHREYVNYMNIKYAIKACHASGLVPVLARCVTKDASDLTDFLSSYGFSPRDIVDCNDIPAHELFDVGNLGIKAREKYKDKLLLRSSNVIRRGRAKGIRHGCEEKQVGEMEEEPCVEVIKRPVIFPKGDLFACCCSGRPTKMLNIGSLKENPLNRLCFLMEQNPIYRFLSKAGPLRLARLLEGRRMMKAPRKVASVCEICLKTLEKWDGSNLRILLEDHFKGMISEKQMHSPRG